MAYDTTGTDRWLAQCVGCSIPEISNAFNRAGITFRAVNGLLGLTETPDFAKADEVTCERPEAVRAWKQIEEWCRAAAVKRNLRWARFGFLGGYYSGMLDMYSDFTMLQAQTGMDIEVLEMSDLDAYLKTVTDAEVRDKLKEIQDFFEISGDSPSDPIAKKPTEEQLTWSAKVAIAQEKMVRDRDLDSVSYFLDKETLTLFGYIEIEDEKRWSESADTEVNRKWWDFMADIMETNPDNSPVCVDLRPVFHLD